ncbi:hypothetical protein TKK_0009523 [Trichogramma kaykai]
MNLMIPDCVLKLIRSYFSEKILLYHTYDGTGYKVTADVPQGSVLGQTLWNIMYDGILTVQFPKGIKIVGYADDIAIVVKAKHLEDVTLKTNRAIRIVRDWLQTNGLQLADHKTEAVLVTSWKQTECIELRSGDCMIMSACSLRYLGVQIDFRPRFAEHLAKVSEKASRVTAALSRIMPNVGGTRQSRRRLLALVIGSVILYAAPIRHGALKVKAYSRQISSARRRICLRVIAGFLTISNDAACVLADVLPLDLKADKRARLYEIGKREDVLLNRDRKLERTGSLDDWRRRSLSQEHIHLTRPLFKVVSEQVRETPIIIIQDH